MNWTFYPATYFTPTSYDAEIFLCKLWRQTSFFQFEVLINVLLSSFLLHFNTYVMVIRNNYAYSFSAGPSLDISI